MSVFKLTLVVTNYKNETDSNTEKPAELKPKSISPESLGESLELVIVYFIFFF